MVNRDVSGLGVDHLNDVDLHDVAQVEIIKGPSSLLYANGTIGGIINVVNNTIAREDLEKQEITAVISCFSRSSLAIVLFTTFIIPPIVPLA